MFLVKELNKAIIGEGLMLFLLLINTQKRKLSLFCFSNFDISSRYEKHTFNNIHHFYCICPNSVLVFICPPLKMYIYSAKRAISIHRPWMYLMQGVWFILNPQKKPTCWTFNTPFQLHSSWIKLLLVVIITECSS